VLNFSGMLYYGKNDRHRISDMTKTWTHLESASLPRGYRLEAWLGGDEHGAFFRTAPGREGKYALVKLVPEDLADAETQLALWRRTRRLDHPNLLPLLECGRTNIAGEAFVYAVFEYPDDRLDTATEQRPLSQPEVRAVLAAVAEGLRYLHAQGLVHGALDAGHVVAVGDCIKLATDNLRESGDGETAQAEDSRMLAELAAALKGSVERITDSADPVPAPATSAGGVRPGTGKSPVPPWIYFGVGGLLLLIVWLNGWLNVGRRASPDKPPAPAPVRVLGPGVVTGPPPRPVFRQPEPAPAARPVPAPAIRPVPAGRAMWRVIAYTYTSRAAAEKKVRAIGGKWPDLHPQVFVPGGRNGMYLVALGGRMTREEAVNLQRRAHGQGLPRDTYVQNYSE
jgi:eukaryotic-like serine/threonine-protein kinase